MFVLLRSDRSGLFLDRSSDRIVTFTSHFHNMYFFESEEEAHRFADRVPGWKLQVKEVYITYSN